MKVFILYYDTDTLNYTCETRKGRIVKVDPYCEDIPTPLNKLEVIGKFMKLRNDTLLYKQGGYEDVYLPNSFQWYPLDEVSGKKLHIVPDEL